MGHPHFFVSCWARCSPLGLIFPLGSLRALGLNISPWGYKQADLLIRHENPTDEIGQQTTTSEEDEKQPNYANKSCVNSEIFSYATANASDLFVF